jgi:3,4-dihydroxy 2-butanone 4-phosphate synthase/GTP cyclohydrolase II
MMSRENGTLHQTAFTVSIEAKEGVTTGISAHDRARTISVAIDPTKSSADIVTPGHVFPLVARRGGVLVRAGHTEGSVDLVRLAGLKPAAVIIEVLREDGSMARLPDLLGFAKRHGLRIATIAQIIEYRRQKERLIEKLVDVALPTRMGPFRVHLYRSRVDEYLHIALCAGGVGEGEPAVQPDPVLVRVHSECLTGDLFGSLRCECGEQMEASLRMIAKAGKGVFLYIRQEGRGIGLLDKLRAYRLQDEGADTVEANLKLGLPADLREYGTGAQILFDLGVRKIRLLTNNPRKVVGLESHGLEVIDRIPIEIEANDVNRRYLTAKRDKLGHLLNQALAATKPGGVKHAE